MFVMPVQKSSKHTHTQRNSLMLLLSLIDTAARQNIQYNINETGVKGASASFTEYFNISLLLVCPTHEIKRN